MPARSDKPCNALGCSEPRQKLRTHCNKHHREYVKDKDRRERKRERERRLDNLQKGKLQEADVVQLMDDEPPSLVTLRGYDAVTSEEIIAFGSRVAANKDNGDPEASVRVAWAKVVLAYRAGESVSDEDDTIDEMATGFVLYDDTFDQAG